MRPMPAPDDDHSSSLLVLIFDSTLMGGLLAFLIAQLSKPVTNWCATRDNVCLYATLPALVSPACTTRPDWTQILCHDEHGLLVT